MWSDDPIRADDEDLLARTRYVDQVAALILRAQTSSTVFAVVSPWGSGKTSVLNLVDKRLAADAGWTVRWFSPWAAADVDSLVAELFVCIASALPKNRMAAARKAVLACGEVALPLAGGLPIAGAAVAEGARRGLKHLADEGDWTTRFDKAVEALRRVDRRILVIVDDVDRLQADELAGLLKAVRLLGRFPNIHYLLAYDAEALRRTVGVTDVIGVEPAQVDAYLEKIVQVALPVPPAQPAQLAQLFDSELEALLGRYGITLSNWNAESLGYAYQLLMSTTLVTVRSIRRFFIQANAYLPLVGPDEINIADYLVLTYLNQVFPRLYDFLWFNRAELTGSAEHRLVEEFARSSPSTAGWEGRVEACGVPVNLAAVVTDVLGLLFPDVKSSRPLGLGAQLGARDKTRRINDGAYFGRYFALAVPEDDFADRDATRLLESILDGSPGWAAFRSEAMSGQISDQRIALIGDKLRAVSGLRDSPGSPLLAVAAASLLGVDAVRASVATRHRNDSIEGWLAMELSRIEEFPHPADAVRDLLNAAPSAPGSVVRSIATATPTSGGASDARRQLAEAAALAVLERMVDNVRGGDEAAVEPWMYFWVFAQRWLPGEAPARLREELSAGAFSAADLSARFVSTAWTSGEAGGRLYDFDLEGLRSILTEGELEGLGVEPDRRVDVTDLGWRSRGAYASRALVRAQAQEAVEEEGNLS